MKQEEKMICEMMYHFVKEKYSKINLEKAEITLDKKHFLNMIQNNVQYALWILLEVCVWAMDKEYLKEIFCEVADECDFSVIKIADKYIKLKLVKETWMYEVNFCEVKIKQVEYFD